MKILKHISHLKYFFRRTILKINEKSEHLNLYNTLYFVYKVVNLPIKMKNFKNFIQVKFFVIGENI